jgi:hypothetical protein
MGYGASVQVNDTYVAPLVGAVDDCTIEGNFELSDDNSYATIKFVQPNGSTINRREYDDAEKADKVSAAVKHICTKYMTEEEYIQLVGDDHASFAAFIQRVNTALINKITPDVKLRVLFHYNTKNYAQVSNFPPFMESMSIEPAKSTLTRQLNSKYVQERLVKKEQPRPDSEAPATTAEATEDLPF